MGGDIVREVRWERMAAILICVLSGILIVYLLLQYVLPLLMPFLVAFAISWLIRPVAKRVSARTHLPHGACAVLLLLLIFGFGGWGLWLGSVRLITELGELIERLLSDGGIFDAMDSLMVWTEQIGIRFGLLSGGGESTQQLYDAVMQMVGNVLSSIAARLPEVATALFSALPAILLFFVVSVVACFYFCIDGESVIRFLRGWLPKTWQQRCKGAQKGIRDLLRKYIRAYGLLLLITMALLLVGFWVLRVEYAFLLALLIALADFLPVIGVGTILIPWGIVMLLQRQFYLGFGLLTLYLIISLIRQVAEPKILGKSLGLHPLLTLLATYVGFSLYGLWGMLLAPLIALLCQRMLSAQIKQTE